MKKRPFVIKLRREPKHPYPFVRLRHLPSPHLFSDHVQSYLDEMVDDLCPRCRCCSTEWEECWNCGGEGGRDGEELMSEDPLWYMPDDFETCDVCNGNGGWNACLGQCDENGKHEHYENNL